MWLIERNKANPRVGAASRCAYIMALYVGHIQMEHCRVRYDPTGSIVGEHGSFAAEVH